MVLRYGYGYFTNSEKTQLLVKPELEQEARQVFAETGIRIVTGSLRYLGSEIGSEEAVAESVQQRVAKWKEELKKLTEIAKTEPHAAYAAISHGLRGRWTYLLRTVPFPAQCLTDLDKVITEELLPALAGRDSFLPEELNLLRLPCRLGGGGGGDGPAVFSANGYGRAPCVESCNGPSGGGDCTPE